MIIVGIVIGALIVGYGLGYGYRGWTNKQIKQLGVDAQEVEKKL